LRRKTLFITGSEPIAVKINGRASNSQSDDDSPALGAKKTAWNMISGRFPGKVEYRIHGIPEHAPADQAAGEWRFGKM
jgi:hypothetical protein